MARTYQALAAAVSAVVVLGVAGCSDDSGADKPAKSKDKAGADGSTGGGDGTGGTGKDGGAQSQPNGVEKLSAKAIVDKAVATTDGASTKRLVVPAGVDLTMDRKGNCAGTVTVTSPQQVLRKRDQVWVKPKDEAAFFAGEDGKALLAAVPDAKGKYMHGTKDESFSLGLLSLYCEFAELGRNVKSDTAVKGGRTTVDGHDTVSVKVTSDKDVITLHIATEGKPYILKAEESKEGKVTQMLLSDFGKPFTPPATPPAAQTYDAAKAEEAMLGASGSGLGGSS
ncbi:hypothetical protein ACFY3O_28505 [Streptomyces sp. NPDC001046]|uniref:hypothetical protein n=1 Tax=Streptomyces sp. NPDC001046 TaxID=3364543 RepID=UPI0036CA4F16